MAAGRTAKKGARAEDGGQPTALGFGFLPADNPHHFLVWIPKHAGGEVAVSEHLGLRGDLDATVMPHAVHGDDVCRVVVPRGKWDAVADALRGELNQRLRAQRLPAGAWKAGKVPVARLLGKELVVLLWSIEDADPSLVPVAVQNWLGLAPEERWWLYTMTAAATGHAKQGRGRGWRKALRYALSENPASVAPDMRSVPQLFAALGDDER